MRRRPAAVARVGGLGGGGGGGRGCAHCGLFVAIAIWRAILRSGLLTPCGAALSGAPAAADPPAACGMPALEPQLCGGWPGIFRVLFNTGASCPFAAFSHTRRAHMSLATGHLRLPAGYV